MVRGIYNLITYLADMLVWIPAIFNQKLALGVQGRKQTFDVLKSDIAPTDRIIWMHVASLGEFEQGRPVLERLKSDYPKHKIFLSFFSPSGYEPRKNYEYADVVCYLPLDTQSNAATFMELAHPELIIFVKYEFWPNYLNQIKFNRCKSILISTVIRPDNLLLKYQSNWFADLMNAFDYIMTQDSATSDLLTDLDIQSDIMISGDTRVDRTLAIAAAAEGVSEIERFCGDNVMIAGSTWPQDEANLSALMKSDHFEGWKMIIAPHEIGANHIDQIINRFDHSIRYSEISQLNNDHRVLVIDNIGLLNKIYRYGHIAYIGGGFGSGIHNTLEPAAYGLPIIFGPRYHKFVEAERLVETGGAFVYEDLRELIDIFSDLLSESHHAVSSKAVQSYMKENSGATDDVMNIIKTYLN